MMDGTCFGLMLMQVYRAGVLVVEIQCFVGQRFLIRSDYYSKHLQIMCIGYKT